MPRGSSTSRARARAVKVKSQVPPDDIPTATCAISVRWDPLVTILQHDRCPYANMTDPEVVAGSCRETKHQNVEHCANCQHRGVPKPLPPSPSCQRNTYAPEKNPESYPHPRSIGLVVRHSNRDVLSYIVRSGGTGCSALERLDLTCSAQIPCAYRTSEYTKPTSSDPYETWSRLTCQI